MDPDIWGDDADEGEGEPAVSQGRTRLRPEDVVQQQQPAQQAAAMKAVADQKK